MREVIQALNWALLWAKWHLWSKYMVEPDPFAPTKPIVATDDTAECAICHEPIARGSEYLLAAFGPVHRNSRCEHASFEVSRVGTEEDSDDSMG